MCSYISYLELCMCDRWYLGVGVVHCLNGRGVCAAYNNQMYMVSRDTILQHTHVEYKRAYNIITARE